MTKTCRSCDDTGWVQKERDGRSGVVSCECRERKIAASGRFDPFGPWPVPPVLGESTLTNFKCRTGCRGLNAAKSGADAFIKQLCGGDFHGGIIFCGGPGLGKSHLAVGIVEAVDRRAHWIQAADFMARLRQTFNSEGLSSDEDLIAEVQDVALLVLDDLGAERLTGYAEETIYRIIDARQRERRPLVVTTNRTIEEGPADDLLFDHIGPRAYDRLLGMCWKDDSLNIYRVAGTSFRWGK